MGSPMGNRKGKRFRLMQSSFKGISREKYFNVHVKNPFQPPPVGVYRTKFDGKDPKVTVPIYGSKERWGGEPK